MTQQNDYQIARHTITGAVAVIAGIRGLDARKVDHQNEIDDIAGQVATTYDYLFPKMERHRGSLIKHAVDPDRSNEPQ